MTLAYILSDGNTASTDYFLFPYLESLGYTPQLLDTHQSASEAAMFHKGSLIVISRYFPVAWRERLVALSRSGTPIVYFMDDDLFDFHVLAALPWRYRWKILRLAMGQKRRLLELCSEFWVSTPYLAQKYAQLNPRLILPSPSPKLIHANPSLVKVCYHATASHRSELHWLFEVVRQVQLLSSHTHFEIFGDSAVKRLYRGLPRVSILHAMNWTQYLAWSGTIHRDIALAPLLPSPFNSARGPTKFYDYARIGAAGIYSSVAPYKDFVRDGIDGRLIDNDPGQWAQAIVALAGDPSLRRGMAVSARERALGLMPPPIGNAALSSSMGN